MHSQFTFHTVAQQIETEIRGNRLLEFPVPWQDELIFPHYGGLSIYNTSQTIAQIFGIPAEHPLDSAVWGDTPLDDIQRVVLIITDGLGYKLLNEYLEEDAALRDVVSDLTDGHGPLPLTSTAPSTTATALPALWTARTPMEHGMLGTTVFLRECGLLANLLHFAPEVGTHAQGALAQWGILPEIFVPVQGIGQLLLDVGVPTHLLLDKHLLGSGLSRILHRGIHHRHTHIGAGDTWMRLRDVLTETAGKRCCVNTYLPVVDALSHFYGMRTPYLHNEIKRQLTAMRDVLADEAVADGQTLVMILADHGHHDQTIQIAINENQTLHNAMRLPYGGDSRLTQLYLRQPEGRQQVIDTITQEYAGTLTWVDPQDAVEAGLFGKGEPHADLMHRLGDLIVISRLGANILDSRFELERYLPVSIHGGLSDWEMLVPFLWQRL